MAKSNRQRKQDRAKAAARKAEQQRRKDRAEQQLQYEETLLEALDFDVPPARLAELVAANLADTLFAARIARLRLRKQQVEDELEPDREPRAGDVPEAARLLIAGTAEPRGIGVLAFAVVGAHADGDEEAEHRYSAELLGRCREIGDSQWLTAVGARTEDGHPGEAFALAREHLAEQPQDDLANQILGEAVEAIARQASGERGDAESAALELFADRSGWTAARDAVQAFATDGPWRERLRLVTEDISQDRADADWTSQARAAYLGLAAEAGLLSTQEGVEDSGRGDSAAEILAADRDGPRRQTLLAAFAAAPGTAAELADQAAAWEAEGRCGIWQVGTATAEPGLLATELLTGAQRYAEFPADALDGAAPWAAWLGRLVPVDGIWRAAGAGLWLSPVEADAVTTFADQTVEGMLHSLQGKPLPPRDPLDFSTPAPHGVLVMLNEPASPPVARFSDSVMIAMSAQTARAVLQHRATSPGHGNAADGAAPDGATADAIAGREKSWLDKPSPALSGLTPREARDGEAEDVIRLESLLRRLEFHAAGAAGRPAADAGYLRTELEMEDPFEAIIDATAD